MNVNVHGPRRVPKLDAREIVCYTAKGKLWFSPCSISDSLDSMDGDVAA